jgi:hypothetical protein
LVLEEVVMKYLKFALVGLLLLQNVNATNWQHSFEWSQYLRNYKNDKNSHTEDLGISSTLQVKSKWQKEDYSATIRGLIRQDIADHSRNVALLEEAWFSWENETLSISAGSQMINWTAMEAFHPVDTLNSANADSDLEKPEKIGEPMLKVEKLLTEESSLTFYYMPRFISPELPDSRSRLNVFPDGFKQNIITNSGVKSLSSSKDQFALRYQQTINQTDFSLHFLKHIDRQHPLFNTQLDLMYQEVIQIGGTVTHLLGEYTLKSEFAWFDYKQFKGQGVQSNPDHLKFAVGLEKPVYHQNQSESTWILEMQKYLDINIEERESLSVLSNDILLAWKHNLNDSADTEWFVSCLVDMEKPKETISNIHWSKRLDDTHKLKLGIRWVEAGSKQNSHLKHFKKNKQVYAEYTTYF